MPTLKISLYLGRLSKLFSNKIKSPFNAFNISALLRSRIVVFFTRKYFAKTVACKSRRQMLDGKRPASPLKGADCKVSLPVLLPVTGGENKTLIMSQLDNRVDHVLLSGSTRNNFLVRPKCGIGSYWSKSTVSALF